MTAEQDVLYQPFTLGDLPLTNRILMAPLTRSRSKQPGDIPWELNATYYAQRAGAGLIFSEATQVSPQGKGYAFTPGIHSEAQVAGWQKVTAAVHDAGGRIYLQLWHVGRISRPELQPEGRQPVAPSAIKPEGAQTFIDAESGLVDVLQPRALRTEEMPDIVDQFRNGAINAQRAGFDGVEIHAANGYLLDQFLRSKSNRRTDAYGGPVENRLRLPLMVVDPSSSRFDVPISSAITVKAGTCEVGDTFEALWSTGYQGSQAYIEIEHRGEIVVIGLGRFGSALASTLIEMGHEVLGVDADEERVQQHAEFLTHVAQADTTNERTLRQLGVADAITAVVAIGADVEASVLTTGALVDIGVPVFLLVWLAGRYTKVNNVSE